MIKNLEMMTMPVEEAKTKYREYLEAETKVSFKYVNQLKSLYYHLSKGRQIIDLFVGLKKVGVNSEGHPKVAVIQANQKTCRFHQENWRDSGGYYYPFYRGWRNRLFQIEIPLGTYPFSEDLNKHDITVNTPLIPASVLKKLNFNMPTHGYYLIWEVEKWAPVAPVDPIIARRLTKNLFVVMHTWDLTPIERLLINGGATLE